ncbi:hypothetical protein SUGI_0754720 [Cryptomeria japonica]|uniref:uncharacterized protein LOC131048847 n=1 Tax=Cryptomeria japonica TaxID=3369 RepID=UPI0024149FD1|nr:uncharacterized protein LOC131048847 [Cryptomeria japonica]GLJ37214.1 hypothetical protein SUGI_0754720 [Cryptomeria japonica]
MEVVSNNSNSNGTPATPSPSKSAAVATKVGSAEAEEVRKPSPQTTNPPLTPTILTPSPSTAHTTPRTNSVEAPKSLRGLNKPKCSECGNVARSRCPFQACKSCCVKARNPCHIHVLKQIVGHSEKLPSQSSTLFDQQRMTTSSNMFPHAVSSRPYHPPSLHHSHPYMPGSQSQIRVKRPLSRKEIVAINSWRFVKLKEHFDSKIEAEDEAFERYMQNVSLLEDVISLSTTPLQGLSVDGHVISEGILAEQADSLAENNIDDMLVEGLKVRLKSNPQRSEKHKERLRKLIDKGLQKLKGGEHEDRILLEDENSAVYTGDHTEVNRPNTMGKACLKKISLVNALNDKLSKARSQEDLNGCIEIYGQVFGKNMSWPEAVGSKQSVEFHRSQIQGETPDADPTKQEPMPMEMDKEESRLENVGLFEQKEMQFMSNPELYLKGWSEVPMSQERFQKNYEDLLIMKDIVEL